MTIRFSTLWLAALLQAACVTLPCLVVPTASEAIVGRPATPRSVAGVGRRTARHAVVRPPVYRPVVRPAVGAVAVGAAMAATAYTVGTVVASQPSGCIQQPISGIAYLSCDGTWFQPQVQSGQVVYVVVAPPI
jgi:hypothetical protein